MNPNTIAAIRSLTDNANPAHLEGWCWFEKAIAMAELIEMERPETVVEVGIFGGRSFIPQALQIRDNGKGRIYGMDPWQAASSIEGEHAKEDREWWEKKVSH